MKKFILKYNKVPSNPSLDFAKRTLNKIKDEKYEEIVSIGGGSTIDVGKYLSFHLKIPHTAIPTTAGTGSEVTKFAVFEKDGQRVSLENKRLIPHNYILDPSRVISCPPLHTASSGLDALSQAIESFWSPSSTKESRKYSKETIKRVMSTLWYSYKNPTNELFRRIMLEAANYSGKAINITKTSICHAISYPLTLHYDIPHGMACAHTLPYFIDYFNFQIVKSWEVSSLIKSLNAEIKTEYDRNLVIKSALKSSRAKNVPKKVNSQIILEALWTAKKNLY